MEEVAKKKQEDEARRKVLRDHEQALGKERKSSELVNMIVAENDDGFASCEEEDLDSKRTGDPFIDFSLDLRKIKNKQERGNC